MIETLANLGEFVGGMAVLISLIYVGLQLRASVRQSRIDSYAKLTELWTQWTTMVVASDEAARILRQGSRDYQSLSPVDRTKLNQILSMYYGILDMVMVQYKGGVFGDDETYRRSLEAGYGMFLLPGVQEWWQANSGRVFAPNIEKYLFERLRSGDGASQ